MKPKQIVQQTDSNSMESNGLSGHYENQCLSLLSHIIHLTSYIIKNTLNVVSNYDRLRPNAINKQRYLKYVGG